MTIVVDATVAIAVLDSAHVRHEAALRRCLTAVSVRILNITRAEALIHPTRARKFDEANRQLSMLGFVTYALDDAVADRARRLRADFGNRNFPMVDAVVVAYGIEYGVPIVTADRKWPAVDAAEIELL